MGSTADKASAFWISLAVGIKNSSRMYSSPISSFERIRSKKHQWRFLAVDEQSLT